MPLYSGRPPLNPQSSARDGETSGRVSQGGKSVAGPNLSDRADALERTDNGCRTAAAEQMPPTGTAGIDRVARERAEGWVSELGQRISEAELTLATVGGFVADSPLGGAAAGAVASNLESAREQIATLRQVVRDLEGS